MNLMADERECDYLLAFLGLESLQAARPGQFDMKMVVELPASIQFTSGFDSRFDCLLDTLGRQPLLTMQSVALNYLDLYKATFYDRCSLCDMMGYLSICLLCGEIFCTRACTKQEEKIESTSSLL